LHTFTHCRFIGGHAVIDVSELYFDLPEIPEEAFLVFEKIMRDDLEMHRTPNGWSAEESFVESMRVFFDVFQIDGWQDPGNPYEYGGPDFPDYYRSFDSKVRSLVVKIKLLRNAAAKAQKDRLVFISDESKSAIRKLIDAIRDELVTLDLTVEKREELMSKLHAFARALDMKFTPTESLFSFAASFGRIAREMGDPFKPVMDRVDRVLDLVEKAEKFIDRLTGPKEPRKLEGPPKRIEPPKRPPSLDDDIPF
jgi:hypothetical protein